MFNRHAPAPRFPRHHTDPVRDACAIERGPRRHWSFKGVAIGVLVYIAILALITVSQ